MLTRNNQRRLSTLVFYAFVLILGFLAYRIVQPFLMSLAWAGILALSASPLHNRLRRRWGSTRAALAATLTTALLIVLPALFLLFALAREVGQAYSALQEAADDVRNHQRAWQAVEWVRAHVPLPDLADLKPRLASAAEAITRVLASSVGAILQNTAVLVFHLVIALVAMFFILRDSSQLSDFFRRLIPFEEGRKDKLIRQTHDLVVASTMSMLTIAVLQGLAGGIVFALLGLSSPVFWGFVMGIFALVPIVGTTVIWGPTALWLLLTGSWARGVILIVFGTAIISTIDNFIRPAMVSGKTSMNGLVVLLSIMGGVASFGFVGLVLGPVIAAAVILLLHVAASEE